MMMYNDVKVSKEQVEQVLKALKFFGTIGNYCFHNGQLIVISNTLHDNAELSFDENDMMYVADEEEEE